MVLVCSQFAEFQKLTSLNQDMRMEMVRPEIGNEMDLIGLRVPDQEVLVATGRRVGMSVCPLI